MRYLILALLSAAFCSAAPAVAGELPYGPSLSFTAWRNGEPIGRHTVRFQRDGDRLSVSTTIELEVKFLGFTAYRYTHRAREVWRDDALVSLVAQTDDNGKPHAVRAERRDGRLEVVLDASRQTLPEQVLPSSHWNFRQVRQSSLLNTQTGAEARIQVAAVGREQIKTSAGSISASRYRYSGDIVMDQWFDDKGRWVKMAFPASDGSMVEYVLQE